MLRATIIVRTLLSVESVVVAEANQECADGKSVLDPCRLAAVCGTEIKFSAVVPMPGAR